ncbi:MAG: DUF362 domain-containing protein [Candidatus Thorarchaeota archaeon]
MLSQSKSKKNEVVISKADTPKESLIKGIEILGGISKFIDNEDQVFIKFNLNLPGGFPTNTNFEVLEGLIKFCKEAGANKIYLGSFPVKGIPINIISEILSLKEYFSAIGAELVFLDNSNYYGKKEVNSEQLKKIKRDSFTKVKLNDNEYSIPNIILNSDKFILVNQINVNPLFKINLALLNSYSIIPSKYREVRNNKNKTHEYNYSNQYKKDLISNILKIYRIKQPDLVINDLFYILEGAGPFIYKDSNLRKTKLMIMGNDTIAVDLITLKLLNIEPDDNDLIKQARIMDFTIPEISNIKVLGEKIEENRINIDLCVPKIEDIKVQNISTYPGKYCTGCYKQAYHFLNFMKTYMVKDLKYNPDNCFLIGENPIMPDKSGNIILFGDCAINSTENYEFRKIVIKNKKQNKKELKNKPPKENKLKKKPKIKEKPNKDILELRGCPPNIYTCLNLLLNYYGKNNLPNLNLLIKMNDFWINGKFNKELETWEAL